MSTPEPGATRAGGPPGREAQSVPTGGLAPPRPLTGHRGLGPACLRSTTSAGRTPYRDRTGDLLLEGEACWPFHQRGMCGRCRPPCPQGGPTRPGWSLSGSNRPPPLCKRGALPDELRPRGPDRAPGDGAAQRSGRYGGPGYRPRLPGVMNPWWSLDRPQSRHPGSNGGPSPYEGAARPTVLCRVSRRGRCRPDCLLGVSEALY